MLAASQALGTARTARGAASAARPLARKSPAAAPEPYSFRPHVGAGVSPFLALVPTPLRARAYSNPWDAKLAAFAAASGNGQWPNLPRAAVAKRLTDLAAKPSLINQAGLNACGPAAALYLFGLRRTEQLVDFAISLYDTGTAKFGSIDVTGSGLFSKDPANMSWGNAFYRPDFCDWMLLSSLLRSLGGAFTFGGEPSDSVSGITFPDDMEKWLKQGIGYTSVSNNAGTVITSDLDELRALRPAPDKDIVILINVTNIEAGSKQGGKGKSVVALSPQRKITANFPNHYFVLTSQVTEANSQIKALGWSWGKTNYPLEAPTSTWNRSYYGAFTATL